MDRKSKSSPQQICLQSDKSTNTRVVNGIRLAICTVLFLCLLSFSPRDINNGILSRFHANYLDLYEYDTGRSRTALMANVKELCQQVEPVEPPSVHRDMFRELEEMFWTEEFRLHAYELLGGAVRVPTETQDEEKPPNEDPEHWKPFEELHAYLESRFPLMHTNLSVTKVNSFALIFHWQGSDGRLKPILLTSHQDVVPVDPETASQWVHPPFSGHFDGEWIWGRGSCDDKSGLIASMSVCHHLKVSLVPEAEDHLRTAVETLLSVGFQPERSIVLAMGIDEERGGVYGATAIRDHLLSTYGKNAFSILIDEGGGYSEKFGATIATPAVAEKGKLDVRVQISTPGGHSSVPPPHTSIGILSRLITELEDNPHPTQLRREGTYYQQLQCLGEHAPSLPATLKKLIKASRHDNAALKQLQNELEKAFREARPSTGTTQAVDIIHGGVKSNALPEQAYAIVNHRIADYSSVAELEARFTSIVAPLAKQFNLSLDAFGDDSLSLDLKGANGHVALSDAYGSALNPAPVSPTFGNGPWDLLSGSILYTFMTNQRSSGLSESEKFSVAPGLSLGNTDTRYYWDLTKHIFRYGHLGASDRYNGAHTVNEAVRAEGFLELVRFFSVFILNADQTDLLE